MLPHRSKLTKYFFIAFLLLVLLYTYFEARNMLYGPQIHLPAGEITTVSDELIEIRGTVKNVVEITLDGRLIFIDSDGNFVEKLLLADGLNSFSFKAKDKFGRKTSEVLNVVYQIPEGKRRSLNTDTIEE